MSELKKVFAICGMYVATLIGAGFASGQEILTFFIKNGFRSVIGLTLSCFLLGICAVSILNRVYISKINDFSDYLESIVIFPKFINLVVTLFMLAGFCVMLSGTGALFEQVYKIKNIYGILIMTFLCFIVFCFDIKGIIRLNAFLAPIMVIGIVFLCVNTLLTRETSVFMNFARNVATNSITQSIIYASYNLLSGSIILVGMHEYVKSTKTALYAGFISGASLFLAGLLMWVVLKIYYLKIPLGQIPFLTIIMRGNSSFCTFFYEIVLFSAMLTSAVSGGYSFIDRLTLYMNKWCAIILVCISGCVVASLGFGVLVGKLYGLFGYVGLLFIFCVIADGIVQILLMAKNKRRKRSIANIRSNKTKLYSAKKYKN